MWVPRPCEILTRGEIGWGAYQDFVYYLCKLFINLKLFKNENIYEKQNKTTTSLKVRMSSRMPSGATVRKQKETNPDQKGKTKTSIFDIIVYTETLKDRLLGLIRLQSIAISPQTQIFAQVSATNRKCKHSYKNSITIVIRSYNLSRNESSIRCAKS